VSDNLLKILSIYCENEVNDFKNNQLFIELNNLVYKLNFTLVCECKKGIDINNKSKNIYLSISIYNQNKEIIEIFDDGYLSASTLLFSIDKKERIKFFNWNDEDFIDSLNWIIKNLSKLG